MWLNFRFCGSAEGAAVDSMPARAHFANQTEQTCFRSIMVCLCVSSTIGCNLQKQIHVAVPVSVTILEFKTEAGADMAASIVISDTIDVLWL